MAGGAGQCQQAVEAKTIIGTRHFIRGFRWRSKAIFKSIATTCLAAARNESEGSKKQLKW